MLRRRIMMAQGGVSLPAGYTKIEYLESDGNHYIDTGFKPNQDTRVVMDLIAAATASTTSGYLCGARESGSSKQFALQTRTEYYAARYGTQEVTIYNGVVTGRQIIDMNKNVYTVNGVSLTLTYETFSCPVSFCLFDINNNGEIPYSPISSMRLYSCQIYDNGTLVRDFIPCTNPDGISGLWDSVNDVFYKMLPADYTRLDFIESDGTTYIDTVFKPNNNTRVVMDVHLLSTTTGDGYPMAFGVYTDNSNQLASFWNAGKWQVWFGNYASTTSSPNIERVKIDLSKDQYIVGDVSLPVSSASFTSNKTLYLLAMNQGDAYYVSQARLYSCQIYDNGTLVRDFIPAMNASGEAGLYDLKNGVWYALKPVAKPKVENKIRVYRAGSIYLSRYGFELQFPSASKITIGYEGFNVLGDRTKPYIASTTIAAGTTKTDAIETIEAEGSAIDGTFQSYGRTIRAITSISPTEDDTYIYTF